MPERKTVWWSWRRVNGLRRPLWGVCYARGSDGTPGLHFMMGRYRLTLGNHYEPPKEG